jgi:hypothetical protein
MQVHMEATMVLNNLIPMLDLLDKPITHLQGVQAIQAAGIRQHAEVPQRPMAFTTTDQTAPTFPTCIGHLLRVCSLTMHILRQLRPVICNILEKGHIQRLSPNLPLPDQGHRLLQPFRASMLAYHSLYHRSLQTLRQLRPRNPESTISLG